MPNKIRTINQRFAEIAAKHPDLPALTAREGKEWKTLTYRELRTEVRRFSVGLRTLGLERGDRVAILSENRTEWAIADLACLAAAGVTVPIYSTLPPPQVAHILTDSGAKIVIVSDKKQRAKIDEIRAQCPDLLHVVVMDEDAAVEGVLTFQDILKRGDEAAASLEETYEVRRGSVTPRDLMCLIYTSGTTGNPKGAMLTHGNMAAAVEAAAAVFPFVPPHETFLSFLPLCHVFERVTYFLALSIGAHTVYNDSLFKLMENLGEKKPSVMQCVPRVFETMHERIVDTAAKSDDKKRKMFEWAMGVGDKAARRRNAGQMVGPILAAEALVADKLVSSKVRERFGSKLRFFVSGGAALKHDTAQFFNAIGIPILEGWGLTETTAAASVNPYGRAKVGTVGKSMPGVTVSKAADGELLIKGPTIMKGYWKNDTATAEVIDSDGWFHTGDIGEIDSEGYIKITDRKKDILVLPNGKNVAPQPIETKLKASPYIAEIVLLVAGGAGVGALVVPNFDKMKSWAKENGKSFADNGELATDSAARKLIKTEIDRLSSELADFEKIKRFALLPQNLTIDGGELTPTLKVKRKVVLQKYGNLLEKE
jgi:long-chain acyl-CoA synthetase